MTTCGLNLWCTIHEKGRNRKGKEARAEDPSWSCQCKCALTDVEQSISSRVKRPGQPCSLQSSVIDPTSDEMIFYFVYGNEFSFRTTHQKEGMKIKPHVTRNQIDIHGMYLKLTHLIIHVTYIMYVSIKIMNMIKWVGYMLKPTLKSELNILEKKSSNPFVQHLQTQNGPLGPLRANVWG